MVQIEMWHFLFGKTESGNQLSWGLSAGPGKALGLPEREDGLVVGILLENEYSSAFGAIAHARELVRNSDWIDSTDAHWVFDFDRSPCEIKFKLNWLRGRIQGQPEYVRGQQRALTGWGGSFHGGLCFYFIPRMIELEEGSLQTTGLSCDSRWMILDKLGQGGQGVVYLVRDKTMAGLTKEFEPQQACLMRALRRITQGIAFDKREAIEDVIRTIGAIQDGENLINLAALKVLHGEDGKHFEGQEGRIRREIEAMAQLSHPNLAAIVDSNADEKWFVSRYFPRGNLAKHRGSFAGNVPASLHAMRSLVSGVAELHKGGIVHRDIKPENIFLSMDGQLVLGDFGLVHFPNAGHSRISGTLENVGSWDWMPEWAKGRRIEEIQPSFDVFSLGKVLWWLVSGRPVETLRLWYFDDPGHADMNIEKIYPNASFVQLVNPLLAKCIVQRESECMKSAEALLGEIDRCLTIITNNGQRIGEGIRRICKVCGLGEYEVATDYEIDSSFRRPDSGWKLRMFTCNHCGHVQFFLSPEEKVLPAWS